MIDIALIQQCSPQIDPIVAQAIVRTESSFNPFAIGVNSGSRISQPQNYNQAVVTAKQLIKDGANIDLGLAQINSNNLNWLQLSIEEAFNPCSNLKAMQVVYNHCYARAGNTGLGTRMQRAFSCYNTGNMQKGFRNGYVNKATKNYNELRPIVINAYNTSNSLPSPIPTPSTLPTNGNDLANFATQLQTNITSNSNLNNSLNVNDVNQPYVIKEDDVTVASSSIPVNENRVIQNWDIFKDF